jgi:hypothetical protein
MIYNVVESVVLGMSVVMLAWVANKTIAQGEIIAGQHNQLVDVRSRIEKLETATLAAAATPGKLEAVSVRLDNLASGQDRIEKLLEKHLNKP